MGGPDGHTAGAGFKLVTNYRQTITCVQYIYTLVGKNPILHSNSRNKLLKPDFFGPKKLLFMIELVDHLIMRS